MHNTDGRKEDEPADSLRIVGVRGAGKSVLLELRGKGVGDLVIVDFEQQQLSAIREYLSKLRLAQVHLPVEHVLPVHHAAEEPPRLSLPPRLIEGFFWLLLPRKVRDAILGDAGEAYAQTMQRYGGARWMATIDYCKEALFAIVASLRMSMSQWISLLFKRSS